MGHAGASRKSPNDVSWKTLSLSLNRPFSAPLLTAVQSTCMVPAPLLTAVQSTCMVPAPLLTAVQSTCMVPAPLLTAVLSWKYGEDNLFRDNSAYSNIMVIWCLTQCSDAFTFHTRIGWPSAFVKKILKPIHSPISATGHTPNNTPTCGVNGEGSGEFHWIASDEFTQQQINSLPLKPRCLVFSWFGFL